MRLRPLHVAIVACLFSGLAQAACPPRPGASPRWCESRFRRAVPSVPSGSIFGTTAAAAGDGASPYPGPTTAGPPARYAGPAVGPYASNLSTASMPGIPFTPTPAVVTTCVVDDAGDGCRFRSAPVPSGTPCNCNGTPGLTQ